MKIALVGIGIDPDSEDPDFYVVLEFDLAHAADRPLTSEGYILLLPKISDLAQALSIAGIAADTVSEMPQEEVLVVDVAHVMYLLQEEKHGKSGYILNLLNTFFDLIRVTPFVFPEAYQVPLYRFANHLTFEDDFGTFFDNEDEDRSMIINGILWLVGAVFSNAKIVRHSS